MELRVVLAGLESGAFYGLIALGYYLFLRATTAVNFAIGAYVMFAGMTSAYLVVERGAPQWLGLGVALAAAIILSWLAEDAILSPMLRRTREEFGPVMAIVAFMFVIEQGAGLLFGRAPLRGQELISAEIPLGDGWIEAHDLLALIASLAVFAVAAHWLKHGRYGRMLRAVGDNAQAARILGLPVRRIRLSAIAATGLVCGLAGIFVAPETALTYQSHLPFAILGFLAFVLGGTANAWAPLAGGLLLAMIETFSARLLGGSSRDYVLLVLVLAVFTFRPNGLFTIRVRT
jgi:branched-chain amino acid transport system permease protein